MANNCCSGTSCQELVTIGYMRELASKLPSDNICTVEVSAASSFTTCCEADESAYTPTYGEILNADYAQLRVIASDPNNDVNGFSASTTAETVQNCCGELDSNDAPIPRSSITFGYTELSGVSISATVDTTNICNPTYNVYKKNTWNRYEWSCGEEAPTSSVTSITDSNWKLVPNGGTFEKNYTLRTNNDDQCSAIYDVTYIGKTVKVETTDECYDNPPKSATSGITADASYTVSISLLPYEQGSIPCSGGNISIGVQSDCEGYDNISFSSASGSTSKDEEPTIALTLDNTNEIIKIPENENSNSEIYVHLYYAIGNKFNEEIVCRYDWSLCSIPIEPSDSCNPYWGEINFDGVVKPENLHDRVNCDNEWTN